MKLCVLGDIWLLEKLSKVTTFWLVLIGRFLWETLGIRHSAGGVTWDQTDNWIHWPPGTEMFTKQKRN